MVPYLDQMKEDAEQDAQAAIDAWAKVPGAIAGSAGGGGDGGNSGNGGNPPPPPPAAKTHLATGGIVTRPTIAEIGEGKGPEAVIPLDKLPDILGTPAGGPVVQQNITLNASFTLTGPLGPEFRAASGVAWDPYMRSLANSLKRVLYPRPGNALGGL